LDPKLLSMGNQLYDEFQPGQTSLDGVPLPYPGWVEQMQGGCGSASVAQALLPYPQYCGSLQGINENAGNSTFHSFQLKAEKRFSDGFWVLGSYTLAKLLTNADNNQPDALQVSPFERNRTKGLALQDVPQTLSVSLLYELPFGKGKRWLSSGGVSNQILGGWTISTVFRANSGVPFTFTSSTCNVPGQFQAACFPAILPGADPFAQDRSNFDPNKPLFNAAAFQDPNTFNFYLGDGPRVSNVRGFGYHNQNFTLLKNFRITEAVSFQLRADVFNLWNWHMFVNYASGGFTSPAFDTDVASPTFGMWTGTITPPRYIQIGTRILF
jgi:hypothetical protein